MQGWFISKKRKGRFPPRGKPLGFHRPENYDRLSAAFRDTLEMGYSVSGFKDGEHQEQRRKKS